MITAIIITLLLLVIGALIVLAAWAKDADEEIDEYFTGRPGDMAQLGPRDLDAPHFGDGTIGNHPKGRKQ